MQTNIGLLVAKRAQLNPAREAFVQPDGGLRMSYLELNDRVNQTANYLVGLGVKKGDRVAILQMNSIEFVAAFFALAKIGGIVVPLNWRLVGDELEFILKDSGASILLFGSEFAELVTGLHGRGDKTDIRHWLYSGKPDTKPGFAVQYEPIVLQQPADEPVIGAADDDELYIMYTSGTTGLPKGVVHTHNTAMWASITGTATISFRESDRYLLSLPLFHVGALNPLTNAVYTGITCVVMRAFDPVRTWELIQEEKITTLLAVPAMLNFMLQALEQGKYDYSTVRWCMSGAAPVPKTMIETYDKLGIGILQVYGLTETCGPACLIGAEDSIVKAGSTGKAFFHTSVRIVDENMNDVGPNEPGEVLVAGKHIMKEYWNRPDATAETLVDGWLRTGDMAEKDEDGFIYIRDRLKDMIISGGENIYPAELENVLLAHEKIRDVAVIGQPSDTWGESPFVVAVKGDPDLTEAEVLKFCRGKIASYKLPKGAAFVDEIPRNPTGKVLKRVLREQFPGPAKD
jgi:O-succinylbenzoate-CoA ligase